MIRPWSSRAVVLGLLVVAASACSDGDDGNDGFSGPGVNIQVTSLNLEGIGDVVWDLEMVNGAGTVVWQQRISSAQYGDAQGGAAYVGPCDPTAGVAENTVKVWVVGAYSAPVSSAGKFQSGATTGEGAVTGQPLSYGDLTAGGPLIRPITCLDGQDVFVQFDISLAPTDE